MSKRTSPPFRADHVGSLLRPPELLQAREDFAQQRISAGELWAVEDDSIRDIVRMQEEVGLQSATDGEFRRTSWHMDFIYQLDGVDPADEQIKVEFHNEQGDVEFTTAICTHVVLREQRPGAVRFAPNGSVYRGTAPWDAPFEVYTQLVWSERRSRTPALEAFIETARATLTT